MSFNREKVEANIEKCKVNILEFEKAEEKERETIRSYKDMIDSGDSPFPTEALRRGVEDSKSKVIVFQQAADKERALIKELNIAINQNEERERLDEEKIRHIEIVIEDE